MTERFTVPCNGCAACCRRERIILRAEDDKELYVVIPTRKGNDGPIEFVLPHKPNGDCYYLAYGGDGRSDRSGITRQQHVVSSTVANGGRASIQCSKRLLLLDYLDSDVALAAMARSGVPRNIIDQP
jgi:Fe-S-cluster containining protein